MKLTSLIAAIALAAWTVTAAVAADGPSSGGASAPHDSSTQAPAGVADDAATDNPSPPPSPPSPPPPPPPPPPESGYGTDSISNGDAPSAKDATAPGREPTN